MLSQPFAATVCCRRPPATVLAAVLAIALVAGRTGAEPAAPLRDEHADVPDGVHVLDGSYVLNAGLLQVNITNHGLIGSQYSTTMPYANAPSGQWPGGTGDEYLYAAGLWIGARVDGEVAVTTGQPERELRPADDLRATIYESWYETVTRPYPDDRPRGRRLPPAAADDDGDGKVNEETLNGFDDDGDGLIDEDFGQMGDQMMVCTMRDDLPLIQEIYPMHHPIGVSVVQRAAAWTDPEYSDFVALDYEVTNTSARPLQEIYLGFYVDCDIQNRGNASTEPDDLTGYYDGAMRDRWNTFHRIQVGWMKDAAPVDPLPGVFGALFLDCDTDFSGRNAPRLARVRSYQAFATDASVAQDGEPLSDEDRYALMASTRSDPDARPEKAADYKFLISCGPFNNVAPGRTLHFRLALVVGDGMEDMLANALKASELQRGDYYDMDLDPSTGGGGSAETQVCLGDLPHNPDGSEALFDYRAAFMDNTCVGSEPRFGYALISPDDLTLLPDGRRCIWVDGDNCEECFRATGQECTEANDLYWHMADYPGYWYAMTGGDDPRALDLAPGGAPQPAGHAGGAAQQRRGHLLGRRQRVHLRRTGFPGRLRELPGLAGEGLEATPGRVRGAGTARRRWNVIGEWDRISYRTGYAGGDEVLPLGANTGLDVVRYRPVCLDDPRYAGLDEAMQAFVDADPGNQIRKLATLRLVDGAPRPGYAMLIPWEWAPTVLDTFFAVTTRRRRRRAGIGPSAAAAISPTRTSKCATGSGPTTPSRPRTRMATTPTARASTSPMTSPALRRPDRRARVRGREHLRVSQPGDPRVPGRVRPASSPPPTTPPACRWCSPTCPRPATPSRSTRPPATWCRPCITTARATPGVLRTWNMMSRNGQEVASGIYFFVVQSDRAGFEDVVGRFVIVW